MRVSTLIATDDAAYTEHISEYISEFHADTLEVSVCNTLEQLCKTVKEKHFNVALIDEAFINEADIETIDLPLLLWAEYKTGTGSLPAETGYIHKHRRISATVAEILERYAAVTGRINVSGNLDGNITAVWSPGGGAGSTTAALAYAASKVQVEKETFYLSLESFTATPAFFNEQGKSISTIFEMLDNSDGNIKMLIQAIRNRENGISYICAPDNYDDMCILSAENIRELVSNCAGTTDELVVDLPCICDMRARQVFSMADKVLLVTDFTDTGKAKLSQFISQSDVYESIKDKVTLVINKKNELTDADKEALKTEFNIQSVINLPHIQETDPRHIYKTLANNFNNEDIV